MSDTKENKQSKILFPCLVDGSKRSHFILQGMVYLFLSPEKSIYIHSGHILKMIEKGLEGWGDAASSFMKTPD